MAWIKRNILFVVTIVVGVALAGVAGYFVFNAVSDTSAARDKYSADLNDLTQLQAKKPYPSPDNIKIAKDDSQHVADIVKDLGNAFVNFPPPPAVDPREFVTYLNTNLSHFRMEATNANVELLSPDYAFSFQAEAKMISFPQTGFGPWMEQLEEIRAIVDILCKAKINSLDGLQRAPAPGEPTDGADYLPAAITSNQVSITSPYKIAFRGFSEDIANVLKGFANSPHCFLIKDLEITPSKSVPQGSTSFAGPSTMQVTIPVYGGGPPMGEGGGRRRRGGMQSAMPQTQTITVQVPTAPTGPVTILKPMPLFVTMYVDVVTLKNPPALMQKVLDFLKRHYDKIIAALVLICLVAAAVILPKQAEDAVGQITGPPAAPRNPDTMSNLNVAPLVSAIKQLTNPPALTLNGEHNLFNPVVWKKMPDGNLMKIIKTGADALVVTNISPLYQRIGLDRPSGEGFFMFTQGQSGKHTNEYVKVNEKPKSGLYTIRGTNGSSDDLSTFKLQLEILDTGEKVWITKDQPYERVDGQVVDLRYPPEPTLNLSKKHLNDTFTLDGEQYKIVATTNNAVTVKQATTTQQTTIEWNGNPGTLSATNH